MAHPKKRPLWAYIVAIALIAALATFGTNSNANIHQDNAQNSCIG